MKRHLIQPRIWSLVTLAIGLVVPSLIIFVLEVTVGGINPVISAKDIWHRQFAEGHNLFLLAVIGLIPFVVLSIAIFMMANNRTPRQLACIALGGLVGILLVMVPSHVSIWYPLYGPGHMSSIAVVEFLFIPFYCLIPLAVGLLLGRGISQLPYFRNAAKDVA